MLKGASEPDADPSAAAMAFPLALPSSSVNSPVAWSNEARFSSGDFGLPENQPPGKKREEVEEWFDSLRVRLPEVGETTTDGSSSWGGETT